VSLANPIPPSLAAPTTAQVVYTVVMAAAVIGFVAWWWRDPAERRRPYLPLMLLGGLVATLTEPLLDNAVLFGWPHNVYLPVLQANGHQYPLYVPLGFVWFDGGLVYGFYRWFERGVTARQIWIVAAGFIALDLPLNTSPHWFHFAGFFGPQPMDILGYPLYWIGCDVALFMVGGALLWWLIPRLHGRSAAVIVLVPGLVQGLVVGAIAWPIAWALRADVAQSVRWLAGFATLGLAAVIVWLVTLAVARPDGSRVSFDDGVTEAPAATRAAPTYTRA
jgi:hypothetical protein